MSAKWQLWRTPDGQVRWYDPAHRFAVRPGAPFELVGIYEIEPWTGLVGRLPPNALRADPKKQVYGMGGPHYVYLDQQRKCRNCGAGFVFAATEQQDWYENRRMWNEVEAHRCAPCRRIWKAERVAQKRLMAAHTALQTDAGPQNQLELARATLEAADEVGRESLERAVGAARKAARQPGLAEEAESVLEAIQAVLEARGSRPRLP
jgi:hypothetical protein